MAAIHEGRVVGMFMTGNIGVCTSTAQSAGGGRELEVRMVAGVPEVKYDDIHWK
jgi:hypothetical protein